MKNSLFPTRYVFTVLAVNFFSVVELRGQAIFSNPIIGTNPSSTNPYTAGQSVDPHLAVSGIGDGPGVFAAAGDDRYNTNSYNTAAFDPNAYFNFTLTPNPGYEIDFSSFVYTGTVSVEGPTTFAFRSSVDGFSANLGAPSATGATIALSSAPFQNITSPIEFRLYGFGATSPIETFSVNDFTFNGTVVQVPEPSPVFGALVMIGLLAHRERRRLRVCF